MTTVSEPATITPPASAFLNTLSAKIKKRLSGAGGDFTLYVDFALSPGVTILFGASGACKTTLLDCIAGLTRPGSRLIASPPENPFVLRPQINVPMRGRGLGAAFHDRALFPHV